MYIYNNLNEENIHILALSNLYQQVLKRYTITYY